MIAFRSNPLVALVAIAGLLSAQLATATRAHVHLDETSVPGHVGRSHVHMGHGHSHSHSHTHSHSHAHTLGHGPHKHAAKTHPTVKAKRSMTVASGLARATSDHDRDAVYVSGDLLCTTTAPSVIKSTSSDLPDSTTILVRLPAFQAMAWYRPQPPDPAPPRSIYRLNQAILC